MKNKRIPETRQELSELLRANMRKVEELAQETELSEETDALNAAYIAGRMDGLLDAMQLRGA